MPRAKRPLNKSAVRAANSQLYELHERDPRPNALFNADGSRKRLDPNDPSQSDLRRKWMELYVKNGGEVEKPKRSNDVPIGEPVIECNRSHYVAIAARYNDPWDTSCSDVPTRGAINGVVVFDGPKTKSLDALFGQDGLATAYPRPRRAELGTYRHEGVPEGEAVLEIVGDPSTDQDIKKHEASIEAKTKAMEAALRQKVKPWTDEWNGADGWIEKAILLRAAREAGTRRGLEAWTNDQIDLFKSVGHLFEVAWDGTVETAHDFSQWYGELTLIEQALWPAVLAKEGADKLYEEIEALWRKRDQVLKLFEAFASESVEAIEAAFDALTDLGGQLGALIKELKEKGDDWVQAMIEVCRETTVFGTLFRAIAAMIIMIPPTLWVEGYSTAEGYLIPEIIIALILMLITYLSAGAGGTLIAARIAAYTKRISGFVKKIGRIGEVFEFLFTYLRRLGDDLVALVRALYRRISEKVYGAVDKVNKIVRKVRTKTVRSPAGRVLGEFVKGEHLLIIKKGKPLYGGNKILLDPKKTTTLAGVLEDVNTVARRGESVAATKMGANSGGINILRSPKWGEIQRKYAHLKPDENKFWAKVTDEFWDDANKPWMEEAIKRGDNFRLVSDPTDEIKIFVTKGKNFIKDASGNRVKSIFGRELDLLRENGYRILPDGTAVR